MVDDDAVGTRLDRALALVHVERLELLDGVRALRDADGGTHHGVEVDEDAVAEQLVDLVLVHPVARREPEQRRRLVRRVVVDVQVGPAAPALGDVVDELDERLTLGRPVVRPERPEPWGTGVDLDHPEEVLQAPHGGAALLPEGIALEVEEDVALARRRHPAERIGVNHLVADPAVRIGVLLELEPGLLAQPGQGRGPHVVDRFVPDGELVDRRDPGLEEPAPGRPPHPGDEEQVTGRDDLLLARRAAPAREPALVPPCGGPVAGEVPGEQGVEAAPAGPVHRDDVGERDVPDLATAEDEACGRRGRHPGALEQGGIGGDLEQRGHAPGPRELGVADQPPLRGQFEEVGMADEAVVDEGRLVDDLRPTPEGLEGPGHRRGQPVGGVRRALELHHAPRMSPGEPAQLGLLVLVAEGGDPREHRVVGFLGPWAQPPEDVELGDQGELAGGRGAQVARADHQAPVLAEEEHGSNLCLRSDTGVPTPPRYGTPGAGPGGEGQVRSSWGATSAGATASRGRCRPRRWGGRTRRAPG